MSGRQQPQGDSFPQLQGAQQHGPAQQGGQQGGQPIGQQGGQQHGAAQQGGQPNVRSDANQLQNLLYSLQDVLGRNGMTITSTMGGQQAAQAPNVQSANMARSQYVGVGIGNIPPSTNVQSSTTYQDPHFTISQRCQKVCFCFLLKFKLAKQRLKCDL